MIRGVLLPELFGRGADEAAPLRPPVWGTFRLALLSLVVAKLRITNQAGISSEYAKSQGSRNYENAGLGIRCGRVCAGRRHCP